MIRTDDLEIKVFAKEGETVFLEDADTEIVRAVREDQDTLLWHVYAGLSFLGCLGKDDKEGWFFDGHTSHRATQFNELKAIAELIQYLEMNPPYEAN